MTRSAAFASVSAARASPRERPCSLASRAALSSAGRSGVVISSSSLLPLWEKVAVGGLRPPCYHRTPMLCIGYAKSVPDEGSCSGRETVTPHPSAVLRIATTLSHKGRGEKRDHATS